MTEKCEIWPAKPDQSSAFIQKLQTEHGEWVDIETIRQYAGTIVYGVTIKTPSKSPAGTGVLLSQPHAH